MVVHHPFVYRAPFGQPDDLDGGSFALTGDVTEGQMPTIIEWPWDLLQSVTLPGVPVVSMAAQALLDYFTESPAEEWVPAVVPVANQRELFVRKGVFCPSFLARMLLDKVLTPRVAFMTVVHALGIRNQIVQCSGIINWLIVTCIREGANPIIAIPAPAPPVPGVLPPELAAAALLAGPLGIGMAAETVGGDEDEVMEVAAPPVAADDAAAAGPEVPTPRTATAYFQRVPAETGLIRRRIGQTGEDRMMDPVV
jgi:hypothetical protein